MELNGQKKKVLVIIDKDPFQIAFHGAVDADAAIRTVRERRCRKSFLKNNIVSCFALFAIFLISEANVCVANAVVAAALVLVCYSSFFHSCLVVVAVVVAVVGFAIAVATSGYSPRDSSHFILAGKMLICLKLCQCCCCCCCCSVLVVFVVAAAAVAAFPNPVSLSPLQTGQHRSSGAGGGRHRILQLIQETASTVVTKIQNDVPQFSPHP